jgi:four helix bundle protein
MDESRSHGAAGPERLRVYDLALDLNSSIDGVIVSCGLKRSLADQLRRAGESVLLNIAEGAGHYSPARKAYHYQTARASATECIGALTRIHRLHPTEAATTTRRTANMVCALLNALIRAQRRRMES